MTAQFNPEVRDLYERIIKRNVIDNPRDQFEYLPERYGSLVGGGRVREEVLSGNNGHYPPIEAIEANHEGGFYGRASHPVIVGSGRKCGGVGVLKKAQPIVNELDMDYFPVSASHGAGRAPRLTKAIKQRLLEQHPQLMAHHLAGGKIDWGKIWKGIKDIAHVTSKVASNPIVQSFAPEEYRDTLSKVGDVSGAISGMGRKKRANYKRAVHRAPKHMATIHHPHHLSHPSHRLPIHMTHPAHPAHPSHMSHPIHGAGFWEDFGRGFKKGLRDITGIASKATPVAMALAPEFAPEIGAVGLASGLANKALGGRHQRRIGGMTAHRRKSVGHAKNQARGALVRQLMRENGMTLGQASKYIKDHNIPF